MIFKLLVLIILFFEIESNCPNGTISTSLDLSWCYSFQKNDASYFEAEETCKKFGGHLTSIHNMFDNMFLAQQSILAFSNSTSVDFWFGAINLYSQGKWSWMDNSSWDFTDWDNGQQKNTSGNSCGALIISNGKWTAANDCSKIKPFVCRFKETTPSSLTTVITSTAAVSSTPSYPAYMNCTEGWVYFEPTHSCYGKDGYNGQEGNWTEGEQYCQSKDAHLPSFHSYDEFWFLSGAAGFIGNLWTGLYSNENGTLWQWSDGSPVDYLPWDLGRPYRNVSSCAYITHNAIYDINCTNTDLIICKKPAVINTTPTTTISTSPSYPTFVNCSKGWIYFEPTHSCYGFVRRLLGDWLESKNFCHEFSAHLISLHSYDETRFLSSIAGFTHSAIWTGLISDDHGNNWEWIDGSPVDYLPWAPNRPYRNAMSCAYLWHNTISDYDCYGEQFVVCKKSAP